MRACVRDVVKVLAKGISLFLLPALEEETRHGADWYLQRCKKRDAGRRTGPMGFGLFVVLESACVACSWGVVGAVIEVECCWLDEACWLID